MLVGLAVHGDEHRGHLGEPGDRHRRAAHERARASLGGQVAGQDDPPVLDLATGLVDGLGEPAERGRVHDALDPRGTGAAAHRTRVRAGTQQQAERGDDHGLAGTGLTGDHRQPGPQLQGRGVDDAELRDPDLLKHGRLQRHPPRGADARRSPATRPPGRSNLATSRSVNGARCSRARRTGRSPRRTSIRAPGGRSTGRRPSHQSTPDAVGAGDDLDRDHRVGRDHHRAGEQRVRADRHDHQGLDARPDDRPARAEVVGGRARRRREHHPVAAPPRQRPVVDLDDHLDHPLAGGLLDAGLVERERVGHQLAVAVGADVEREPVLRGPGALDDGLDRRLDVVGLRLGQEPDVAEVDAEHRRAARPRHLGGPQDRAVAADDDRDLAVGPGVRVRRRRARAAGRRTRRPARGRPPPPRASGRGGRGRSGPCRTRA